MDTSLKIWTESGTKDDTMGGGTDTTGVTGPCDVFVSSVFGSTETTSVGVSIVGQVAVGSFKSATSSVDVTISLFAVVSDVAVDMTIGSFGADSRIGWFLMKSIGLIV